VITCPRSTAGALDIAITEPPGTAARVATIASTVGVLFGFGVLVTVAFRDRRRLVGHVVLLLACATPLLLQNVFRRPGPPGQPESFSYPSGHAWRWPSTTPPTWSEPPWACVALSATALVGTRRRRVAELT
jgi:membrane-associated phospholipid phosphatase